MGLGPGFRLPKTNDKYFWNIALHNIIALVSPSNVKTDDIRNLQWKDLELMPRQQGKPFPEEGSKVMLSKAVFRASYTGRMMLIKNAFASVDKKTGLTLPEIMYAEIKEYTTKYKVESVYAIVRKIENGDLFKKALSILDKRNPTEHKNRYTVLKPTEGEELADFNTLLDDPLGGFSTKEMVSKYGHMAGLYGNKIVEVIIADYDDKPDKDGNKWQDVYMGIMLGKA